MESSYHYPDYSNWYRYPAEKPKLSNNYNFSKFDVENYCDFFEIGDKAPEFTLTGIINNQPKEVSLSDYFGKWTVLFFYSSNFTFV
jgi:hypothetical protein